MARRYCYTDVVPFIAMVSVECTNVGLNTLFKAATLKGMNYYVFILYSYVVATLVLLPLAFIFLRKAVLPPLKFSILCRIFLLAMLGLLAQMIGLKGIEYSSPTLSSAISNLTAAFTFILAVLFRMEKLTLRSWRTRAKIVGTIVSVSGALIVVLYKGPTILSSIFSTPSIPSPQSLGSAPTNWVIGGILIATQYLLFSFWYIFQTQVMKMYPAELVVAFLYNLSLAIVAAPVCLISERNLSSWRLRFDVALLAIVYAGLFGSSFSTVIHSWGLRLKGPVYIAIFKPLSIAIAAIMGVMFLGDALTVGCVVGAIIISVGFYAVLWGKAKEEDTSEEHGFGSIRSYSSPSSKTPLLQNRNVDVNICCKTSNGASS